MPGNTSSDPRLNRLRRLVAGSGASPVVDFQDFSLSGTDYRGQISSGFGEHGYGLSAGVKIDAGKFLLPGFFTLTAGASITASGARRSMLLLHRDPLRVRRTPVKARHKKDQSRWRNTHPINLMVLRGETRRGEIKLGVDVRLGARNAFMVDEAGAAIAANASLGGSIEYVELRDETPRHYGAVSGSGLTNDVEFLLNANIKRAVALWLLQKAIEDKRLDRRERLLKGLAEATPSDFDFRMKEFFEKLTDAEQKKVLDDVPLFSADLTGFTRWMFKARKAGIGKWNRPTTLKLLKALSAQEREAVQKQAELARRQDLWGIDLWQERIERLATDIEAINHMKQALLRSKNDAYREAVNGPALGPQGNDLGVRAAQASFTARTVEGEAAAGAGIKLNASVPQTIKVAVGANGSISTGFKTIAYAMETPSAANPLRGGTPDRVMSRQETVITYKNYFTMNAQAAAEFSARVIGRHRAEKRGQPFNYGTAVYHSANALWFASDRRDKRVILPNGSGVTKGVSVLASRVIALAADSREGGGGTAVSQKLEAFLAEELNLTTFQLRDFFKGANVDWLPEDRAVLIEAGFALTDVGPKVPNPLSFGWKLVRHPSQPPSLQGKGLLELKPVKDRLQQKKADDTLSTPNATTQLQVLRMRLRRTEAEVKTRSLFSLGLSHVHNFDEADVKRGSVKTGSPLAFRTFRAGAEGAFDFHVRYYGAEAKPYNDPVATTWAREYTIPPVALFNF